MNKEINITITSISGVTDTIFLPESTTSLLDLTEFAVALLGIEANSDTSISLIRDGRVLFIKSPTINASDISNKTLKNAGIKDGDLILVDPMQRRPAAPTTTTSSNTSSGTTLDFSSLLNSQQASTPVPRSTTSSTSNGLTFNIPGLHFSQQNSSVIEWEGMTLDEAIGRNPNPDALVQVIFNEKKHPHLMKELSFHSPVLAKKLKDAGLDNAAKVWRDEIMKGGINQAVKKSEAKSTEETMRERLRKNPMDDEANQYFGEQIQRKNVDDQYHQMMETFPESMGRVLMLYIETKVNSVPMQAFVDSGAQSTIMSATAAEKCGLMHLLDKRFSGTAVGVGKGNILGRIHIAPIHVNGHFFPCTIVVLDDGGKGLGDKNMEFLFGLDMLKRHRCKIDLERNRLVFRIDDGKEMSTPFLHEKDLDETKGGTKGFDADQANKEFQNYVEKTMAEENMEIDGEDRKSSGNEK